MGDTIRISCTACSFERELKVGKGLLYRKPGAYLIESEIPSKQMQIKLFERMEGPCAEVKVIREIYRCEKCYRILDYLSVSVINGKKSYKTKYLCPRCNKTMGTVDMLPEEYHCPKCENGKLHFNKIGQWD